jgi:acid phosphatase type 7
MKIGGRLRATVLTAAAASVLVFATGWEPYPISNDNTWPYATTGKSPVLAVVGDVACQPGTEGAGEASEEVCTDPASPYTSTSLWESQEATANQIETMKPDAVALLGDLQYQVGRYSDFEQSFDLTYGAFKFLHRPAPGNHEFYSEHSQTGVAGYGYFSYYNGFLINPEGMPLTTEISDPCINPTNPAPSTNVASASCKVGKTPTADLSSNPIPRADGQAGHFEESGGPESAIEPPGAPVGVGDGWYSYNLGSWHLISLNIECYSQPGGCSDKGTWFAAETAWLKQDLEENHSPCTLAYWHQPTYSATDSLTQEGITAGIWWQMLYEAGADLVLNGHDHLYARYAPVKPYFDSADTSVTGVTGTWLGTPDPNRGIREFIVGTGGETLDPIVAAPTSATDWDGIFNQQNLEAYTGDYWGVMALTLNSNGYAWDYESALAGPTGLVATNGPTLPAPTASGYSDKGFGTCHNGPGRY